MHIVVVGCGRVGSELTSHLEKDGHTVSIIDKNKNAFRRLPTAFGGKAIEGYGFDRDTLAAAGIDEAGALAAVTNGDNSNIMTARIARETYDIEHVVARIYDPRRAVIYQRLGIPTIATVSWTTDQVLRRLLPGSHHPDWVDPTGKLALVERDLPSTWAGKKLALLDEPGLFSVASVTRYGTAQVPTPATIGQEGDILHVMASLDALDALEDRLAHPEGSH